MAKNKGLLLKSSSVANKVIITEVFARKAKPLLRKYKSLNASLLSLEKELIKNPRLGVSYGANIFPAHHSIQLNFR